MTTCPSPEVLAQVGKPTTWEQITPRRRKVEGVCVGVRRSYSIMSDDEGEWHGIQFCIQTPDGKTTWTSTFADHGAPTGGS